MLPFFIMFNALDIYATYVRNMFCGCCLLYELLLTKDGLKEITLIYQS